MICNRCGKTKPEEAFARNGYKHGRVYRRGTCKDCVNKKAREVGKIKRDKNHEEIFYYLLENPCADCGETNTVVLQFDHIDPSNKSFTISNKLDESWDMIWEEIQKCEVVCANCHQLRTAKQQNWYPLKLWKEYQSLG